MSWVVSPQEWHRIHCVAYSKRSQRITGKARPHRDCAVCHPPEPSEGSFAGIDRGIVDPAAPQG